MMNQRTIIGWIGVIAAVALVVPVSAQVPGSRAADAAAKIRVAKDNAQLEAAVARFAELSARQQTKVLAAVRSATGKVEHPYLAAVRKLCRADLSKKKKSTRRGRKKSRRRKAAKALLSSVRHTYLGVLPVPMRTQYAFGMQATLAIEPGGKKQSRSRQKAAASQAELRVHLLGYLPDLDVGLAALLHRLDHDRSADSLSRLLETWRNGAESFYHALDRTAGTRKSLFYYDSMLEDFIAKCVPRDHVDFEDLRRSSDAAHDALHTSFLAYRQYRAFREAIALALLLPPDIAFPASLTRYEDGPRGHSLRERINFLLHHEGQDLDAVVEAVIRTAPPLPKTLWGQKYEPFAALSALVAAREDRGSSYASNLDRVIAKQVALRRQLQRQIAEAAGTAFRAALSSKR